MNDPRRVVITGTGAVSALGATTGELWRGLLANRSGLKPLERFAAMGLDVTTGGEVDAVPLDRPARDVEMARRAIGDALAAAGVEAEGCGLVWGMGLDTFVLEEGDLRLRTAGTGFAELAAPFGGPRRMVAVACASGTQAIGEAFLLVRRGGAERCGAGGSSGMLTPFYEVGFARLGAIALDLEGDDPRAACRPFDRRRRGLTLADGAGAVVVESADSARRRGAAIRAEIAGFGASQDGFDLNRPPDDGRGALLAMERALAAAGLAAGDVDAVNAHGTATLVGDAAEAAAVRRLLGGGWRQTPVSSAKGAIGHAMAAAGALEAIVACRTAATGIVPPTVNLERPGEDCELDHVIAEPRDCGARRVLSVSLGMGGQNAALIFTRGEQ